MSPIHGVNNQTAFFPIKQDNNLSKNINAEINDSVSANLTATPSGFEMILKSLLENMLSNQSYLPGDNDPAGAFINLSPIAAGNSNTNSLLSILEQKEQPGLLSHSPSQSLSLQLLQFLLDTGIANNDSAGTVSEVPNTWIISRYRQAMNDFRNAFHLDAAGNPEGLNIHTINGILSGDAGAVQNLSATGTPGYNPTKQEVADYITEQCQIIGIPAQLGLATAATESNLNQFNKDGTPLRGSNSDSTDWGIMQVNDKAWGDVFDFNRIKTDWKYNVRAGLQILKDSYDSAVKNNESSKGANSSMENLARAAYSGYNAGAGNVWRYRTTIEDAPKTGPYDVLSNEGYDIRDIRFWNHYQNYHQYQG